MLESLTIDQLIALGRRQSWAATHTMLMLVTHVVMLHRVPAEIGTLSCINVSLQVVYMPSRSCSVQERICDDPFA